MAGGRGIAPPIFRNRRIFRNFNASLKNLWTFAFSKDKGFEFYRKIFELDPPYSRGAKTPLLAFEKVVCKKVMNYLVGKLKLGCMLGDLLIQIQLIQLGITFGILNSSLATTFLSTK